LKVSPNGVRKSPVPEEKKEEVELDEEMPVEEVAETEDLKEEDAKPRPLSAEIRGALALVISQ